jgi:hypothetical protein
MIAGQFVGAFDGFVVSWVMVLREMQSVRIPRTICVPPNYPLFANRGGEKVAPPA